MNKYGLLNLRFLKYKEPQKIDINIIKNISSYKIIEKKNIDMNDINYSENFWKNKEKYEKINFIKLIN